MKRFFGAIWRLIKNNWILKVMAVLFAVILWSYVLAETNPLREREVQDISVRYSHAEELEAKDLAISGSLSDILESVDVRVEVSQNDLKYLSNKNVIAYIDLSSINGPGEKTLSITATSSYGEVLSVSPSEITLFVDDLVTRTIPVSLETTGSVTPGYHAMTPVITPEVVYITGARIDVEKVVSSVCTIDLTGLKEGYSESIEVELLDENGNALDKDMFTGSIPSVIVDLDVLAKKSVPIDTSDMLLGQEELAQGFELAEIIIEPETVDIIGEKSVIDLIDSVSVMSFSISGADSDIVTLVDYKLPEGVSLLSEGQVQAYVSIKEIIDVKTYENVELQTKNLGRGLKASLDIENIDVVVIAGTNQLAALFKENITPYVDLDGLEKGTHELSILFEMPDGFANENVSSETKQVTVTISD